MPDRLLNAPRARLPAGFPCNVPKPKFWIGDRVCWQPLPTKDFGIIIGLHYAPSQSMKQWNWQYVIWLDPQSPSRAWVESDTAWEEALEFITLEENKR